MNCEATSGDVPVLTFDQAERVGQRLFDQLVEHNPRAVQLRPRDSLFWADLVQDILRTAKNVRDDDAETAAAASIETTEGV
jgi:hypothetical protein